MLRENDFINLQDAILSDSVQPNCLTIAGLKSGQLYGEEVSAADLYHGDRGAIFQSLLGTLVANGRTDVIAALLTCDFAEHHDRFHEDLAYIVIEDSDRYMFGINNPPNGQGGAIPEGLAGMLPSEMALHCLSLVSRISNPDRLCKNLHRFTRIDSEELRIKYTQCIERAIILAESPAHFVKTYLNAVKNDANYLFNDKGRRQASGELFKRLMKFGPYMTFGSGVKAKEYYLPNLIFSSWLRKGLDNPVNMMLRLIREYDINIFEGKGTISAKVASVNPVWQAELDKEFISDKVNHSQDEEKNSPKVTEKITTKKAINDFIM